MIHGDEENEGGAATSSSSRPGSNVGQGRETRTVVHTYPTTYLKQ